MCMKQEADIVNSIAPRDREGGDLFPKPLKLDHSMGEDPVPVASILFAWLFLMPEMHLRVVCFSVCMMHDWILMQKLLFQLASTSLVQRC